MMSAAVANNGNFEEFLNVLTNHGPLLDSQLKLATDI
jgi:hypothetical protein